VAVIPPVTPVVTQAAPVVIEVTPVVADVAPVVVEVAPVVAEVAPVVAAAPAATPVAAVITHPPVAQAPTNVAALHAVVQSAGLQWVESDPSRFAQTAANQTVTPVKLGRAPKPVVTISNEPLAQVETTKSV
jgi:ribonuclease E